MSESIPVGLQTLLAKLNFLAQINRGYKPCISNMTLVDGSSWWGTLWRGWYYGENKKTVMAEISKIVNETIDAITTHKHREEFLKLIVNALANTRVGIESMKTTYRNSPETISNLDVQLTNIDLQLNRYRYLIKGYQHNNDKNNDKNNRDDRDRNNKNNDRDIDEWNDDSGVDHTEFLNKKLSELELKSNQEKSAETTQEVKPESKQEVKPADNKETLRKFFTSLSEESSESKNRNDTEERKRRRHRLKSENTNE
jgi:hypothetical protein